MVCEAVPCGAAGGDDGVVVVEDADGEPVGAQVLPDIFHRVQLRAVGREQDGGEVVGDDERRCPVPAGPVEQEDRMRARRDGAGDFREVVVHRGGVGEGQHQSGGDAAVRAGGAEDVGPFVAGVARRARPAAALRPDPGEGALLADPRLVLEPDLERLATRGLGDRCGYRLAEVFLKASCASGSAFGWCGRTESRR